jgi:hypothetical protein
MPRVNKSSKRRKLIEKLSQIKALANQCILEISATSSMREDLRQLRQKTERTYSSKINFGLNPRAYVKRYGKELNGPEIFVLILAYAAKGKIKEEISLEDIETLWKRMTGLIGMNFNGAYPVRAKDNGWIDSRKRGFYSLTDSFKGIFTHE